MKRLSAVTILVLLTVALGSTFAGAATDRDRDRRRPHPTTTTERRHPTTTDRPRQSTTTTTRVRETTTTAGPTTTTRATSGERFTIMMRNADTGAFYWNADYLRDLPFHPNTGWTDGERAGYRCAYMFLLLDGVPVGRVTFARVEGASYAAINDKYMQEGARHYDGSLPPPQVSQSECPSPNIAYEVYTGPDERPRVTYETTGGAVLEVRDYMATVVGAGVKFQQVESNDDIVAVIAYENNSPTVAVYYESLVSGVVMASDLP